MIDDSWKKRLVSFDERRDILVPGNEQGTIHFAIDLFIYLANQSIKDHDFFAVALSGGSTPKAIYKGLSQPENASKINWSKVLLFWSDERCVPLDHPDSNFHMAMTAGLGKLPIPKENIFPMICEGNIEDNAKNYEKLIKEKIPSGIFDLVMLGMGEDGHTASLFPRTHALHAASQLVAANYVPQKNTWRMTLTYDCINNARNIIIYIIGKNKADMVKEIFSGEYKPDDLPIQRAGTSRHKALLVLDSDAAAKI